MIFAPKQIYKRIARLFRKNVLFQGLFLVTFVPFRPSNDVPLNLSRTQVSVEIHTYKMLIKITIQLYVYVCFLKIYFVSVPRMEVLDSFEGGMATLGLFSKVVLILLILLAASVAGWFIYKKIRKQVSSVPDITQNLVVNKIFQSCL